MLQMHQPFVAREINAGNMLQVHQTYPEDIQKFPMPISSLCKPRFPGAATKTIGAQPTNKNVAVLFRGEAFRSGGRGSRDICDSLESRRWQQAITENHMRMLVRPLEEHGHNVDIFLATYGCPLPNTSWNAELSSWYGNNLKAKIFVEHNNDESNQG